MAALIDAVTLPDDIADWADTTPGYGTAASLNNVGAYGFSAWISHSLLDGIYLVPDGGGGGGGTTKESWGVIGV
jgi:hypothetical protein